MPSMPLRRKKWTEEEEETLIAKYGELLQCGFLSKMKTRERKFEPIAAHVNALFHSRDPVAYPWQWSWKDASTKVQNMRHQYLGVKQKIRRINSGETGEQEDFNWDDGLSHWSNFLRYKEVFGDQELEMNDFLTQGNGRILAAAVGRNRPRPAFRPDIQPLPKELVMGIVGDSSGLVGESGGLMTTAVKEAGMDAAVRVGHAAVDGGAGVLGLGLGFEYEGECDENGIKDGGEEFDEEEDDVMDFGRRKKRKQWRKCDPGIESSLSESRILSFIALQFAELREREARREERDKETEREREKTEILRAEAEKDRERARELWEREREEREQIRLREAEKRQRETEEQLLNRELLEQRRRREDKERERAWEEKLEREKMEWREKMEAQHLQHQATMMQIQSQIAQSQQNTVTLLLGLLLQFNGQANDLSGQGSSLSPIVSQLLQNLQQPANGMVQCGVRRGGGESSDSQFDVDG